MKKISIITVCYNEPKLQKTCESIVNQTFQDFEWIVIDGGSDKPTLDIFEKYKKRIDYFVSEKDSGIYNAMNKGIERAKGERFLFMNAGDAFTAPDILEKASVFIEENKDIDVLYGTGYFEYPDKKILMDFIPKELTLDFFKMRSLCHQAMFFKNELFDKYGGYDENYRIVSDWKYALVLCNNGHTFKYIDLAVVNFDANGISITSMGISLKEREKVLAEFFTQEEIVDIKKRQMSNQFAEFLTQKRLKMKKEIEGIRQ